MATKRSKAKARPKARVRRVPSKKTTGRPREGDVLRASFDTVLFTATTSIRPAPVGTRVTVRVEGPVMLVETDTDASRYWLNWAIYHSDWEQVR